ncbi:MAG TPA: PAS domain S-box protein, partial [Thermoanaerobaculia bacterium]|nr:PAS domain S-box protein [Thermoanaerobaculia bacterium]
EVLGKHFGMLLPRTDRNERVPEAELLTARSAGRAEVRRWQLRKDGSRFYADGVTFALRDGGELLGFAKVARDATDRFLTEQRLALELELGKLLAVQQPLEQTATSVAAMICERLEWDIGVLWEADPSTGTLRCSSVYHAEGLDEGVVEDLCGIRELATGVGLPGRVYETGQTAWISDVTTDPNFPRAATAERYGIRSGFAFPILLGDEVLGVMEFFSREVRPRQEEVVVLMFVLGTQIGLYVERRRALDALKESEERYRIVAEAAQDAIITIDEHSTIQFVNSAAGRMFGYQPEALIGRSLHTLMPERFRSGHDRGLSRYRATGRRNIPWEGVELPGLRSDGTEFPLEISFGQSKMRDRRLFTGYARDISERKRIEREREELLRQLEAANQSKDVFLAMVSHELRTPMTSISGWLNILADEVAGQESPKLAVEMIRNSAATQAQLIDDILDVSRIVSGKLSLQPRPIDISAVVTAATQSLEPSARDKGIEVACEITPSVQLTGDPARLQQVVWNLLSNAIKFTPGGGRITVGVEQRDGSATIRVSDTGEGIPQQLLEHIFEPFRQARDSGRGGLGLGLAIVRSIVEMHGGRVRAESAGPGTGSTFSVELPVLNDEQTDEH